MAEKGVAGIERCVLIRQYDDAQKRLVHDPESNEMARLLLHKMFAAKVSFFTATGRKKLQQKRKICSPGSASGAVGMEVFMQIVLSVLMLIVGFVLLVKGADWFVDGAAALAGKMGIPQLVIGLTIVALGTSLPEAAVSITSALQGSTDITVGNVVGSNIMNILVILGISAVITNVRIQKSTLKYELPFMLLITVVFLAMGMLGGEFTRLDGVILWGFMIVYLIYLLNLAKKGTEEEEEFKDMPIWKCLVCIVLGAVMIVGGSNLVVDGASDIASAMGISDRIIGLTIVAFGTSLPELVTSVSAAKKGNAGIAIGNIVGSNIFNILFVLGTTALICPVPFASSFLIDSLVAIGAGLLLWFGTMKHKELRRPVGIVMLVCYAAYFVYLCYK